VLGPTAGGSAAAARGRIAREPAGLLFGGGVGAAVAAAAATAAAAALGAVPRDRGAPLASTDAEKGHFVARGGAEAAQAVCHGFLDSSRTFLTAGGRYYGQLELTHCRRAAPPQFADLLLALIDLPAPPILQIKSTVAYHQPNSRTMGPRTRTGGNKVPTADRAYATGSIQQTNNNKQQRTTINNR
jgi:hypothetical protein